MSADAVSAPLRAVLELFAAELSQVKFPELDGAVLRESAEVVSARADAVTKAEAALERARAELAESQELLLQRGQKALAYARIFAEDNPELLERVEAIVLPRAARRAPRVEPVAQANSEPASTGTTPTNTTDAAPRKRGRPAKSQTTAPLFIESHTANGTNGSALSTDDAAAAASVTDF
jgi:ElaB/YqjD/DUF883 family membrane-anchored ribosome-binding protein